MNRASRVPLRLSLAGGGTDIEPFASQYGSNIVSFTIGQYVHAYIETHEDMEGYKFESLDTGESFEELKWDDNTMWQSLGIASALTIPKHFRRGIRVYADSPVLRGSGLGASSAIIVAVVGLLKEHSKQVFTKYDLAASAFDVERNILKISGGFQDQFACTFGGVNVLSSKSGRVSIEPLSLSRDFLLELERSIILINMDLPREGDKIIAQQQLNVERENKQTMESLNRQLELADEMITHLVQNNIEKVGKTLSASWEAKKGFASSITNTEIDDLYRQVMKFGATGAKITGAGGGGHMMMVCPRDKRNHIVSQIKSIGLSAQSIHIVHEGYESWSLK
jgi:D-glycero-alpha-D-manno-heptose-7-phosphate kinase